MQRMNRNEVKKAIDKSIGEYFATHDEVYDLSKILNIELLEKLQKPSVSRNKQKLWECIDDHAKNMLCLGFYHGICFAAELKGGVVNE